MEKKRTASIEEKPGLCDVLLGIFRNFRGNRFVNDRALIHYTFYELRKEHSLLSDLVFKEDVLFPESQMLDEALYSLQPEFLGKINPSFDYFQIKKDRIDLLWEKDLKKKLEKIGTQLADIAEKLEEKIGVRES